MLSLEDILMNGLHRIQEEMASQDINASGASCRSFRVSMESPLKGKIVYDYVKGYNAPLDTLEEGRGPGKMPPVEAIRAWLDVRGIGQEDERDRIAWAVSRAIADKGTTRHSRPSTVLSGPVEEIKSEIESNDFWEYIVTYLWQRKN